MSTVAKPVSYGPSSAADPTHDRRFGGALGVSATLHGLALVLLVVLTLVLKEKIDDKPPVFQLVPVAGLGDDFMATEAPAGHEAGRATTGEIQMPDLPVTPIWTPPAEAVPVQAVPPPPVVESTPVPNFARDIKATIKQEQRKVERELRQQRAAEAKAAAAAATAAEKSRTEAAKTTSYEQFKKEQGVKGSAKPAATPKADPGRRIDANGIKQGVTGAAGTGSTGAGGTALSRAQANAMDAYDAMLRARLRDAHVLPPGVSDLLGADVVFTIAANGTISGVRIVRSSGNAEFDQSVLEAFARVRMPARPDARTDSQRLTFRIREA